MPVTPTTHLEQYIAGEVQPVTHLEKVLAEYGGGGGGGGSSEVVTIDIDTDYPALGGFMLDEFSSAIETLVYNAGKMMAFEFAIASVTDAESELSALVSAVNTARNSGKIARGIFLGTLMDVTASGAGFFSFSINYFLGTMAPGEVRVNVHFSSTAKKAFIIGTYADFSTGD